MQQPITSTKKQGSLFKVILLTGILAGTLDAVAAIVVYQVNPKAMFQFIASGALGNESFAMGWSSATLGILFHFFIALCWTSAFFLLYPKMKILSKNKYVTAVFYGIIIWMGMNLVVLPLSRIDPGEFDISQAAVGATILIFAIGLPLSVIAQRYYTKHD